MNGMLSVPLPAQNGKLLISIHCLLPHADVNSGVILKVIFDNHIQ